ncbi:MAG TPA: HlyD family type I secretion periplasmic adaptor subunit [Sphingomonas sp.]|nr:HlyD family type I secretion periplasmic adaptor subunit [Sphingomonas sp.]
MSAALIPYADPEVPAELGDDPRWERRLAAGIAGFFFIGLLGWAALTPLDAAAYGHGVVEVAGNRQAVQHRDGGIVAALMVKEGDRVASGQPLLRIVSADIEAEERGLTSEYLGLLAQRARLQAERQGRSDIPVPAEFAGLSDADRGIAAQLLREQAAVLRARQASQAGQQSVLGQRARQSGAEIRGYQADIEASVEQLRLLEVQIQGMKELEAKGFASANRIRELERQAAALRGSIGQNTAMIARSQEVSGENRMRALTLERGNLVDIDDQLRDTALRLNEARPKLTAARERLARTVVRAPAAGRIVSLSVFTVGGVIAAGEPLMYIVPDNRELVVQARLSPDDADDVQAGLPAKVRFPSLHERDAPQLDGRVAVMSADALTDEKSGAHYFAAEIRVPSAGLERYRALRPGADPIRAGLPADVLISLRKRTVLGYLLEPLIQSTWRSGREH